MLFVDKCLLILTIVMIRATGIAYFPKGHTYITRVNAATHDQQRIATGAHGSRLLHQLSGLPAETGEASSGAGSSSSHEVPRQESFQREFQAKLDSTPEPGPSQSYSMRFRNMDDPRPLVSRTRSDTLLAGSSIGTGSASGSASGRGGNRKKKARN